MNGLHTHTYPSFHHSLLSIIYIPGTLAQTFAASFASDGFPHSMGNEDPKRSKEESDFGLRRLREAFVNLLAGGHQGGGESSDAATTASSAYPFAVQHAAAQALLPLLPRRGGGVSFQQPCVGGVLGVLRGEATHDVARATRAVRDWHHGLDEEQCGVLEKPTLHALYLLVVD